MAWMDPIVGGIALRIPAIQSPNYAAGSAGWTINVDGSAEFNNLTIRGTFVGTDYIINSSGAFFYSGTPAAGNLITSIAANSGVDGFGNPYPAGLNNQAGAVAGDQFANINQGNIFLGALGAGAVPDTTDAAQIFPSPTLAELSIRSGITASSPDPAFLQLWGGAAGQATGSATAPFAELVDFAHTSAVDLHLSGSVISTDDTGAAHTWQTPAYNTNWSAATSFNGTLGYHALQYRLDAENNLHIIGCFQAGASLPTDPVFTLPAGYRPSAAQPLWGMCSNSGSPLSGHVVVGSSGAFDLHTANGLPIQASATYVVSGVIPLNTIS